jgi:lipopolysaccharide export system permease protein
VRILDKYVLNLALWPMLGSLGVTLVAQLLERVLRLLDQLSNSSDRFGYVAQAAINLVPHYLGLTLPAGFFIALFVVITRLNEGSEIDALLASGVSLTRLATPYILLGVVLAMINLALFGYVQPYSRYAFREVMQAAQNAGWNGEVPAQTFINTADGVTMTVDNADPGGRRLNRVFIRKLKPDGSLEITTAASGRILPNPDGKTVTLELHQGQQFSRDNRDQPQVLSFGVIDVQAPLTGAARLLRARGGDHEELTLDELVREANRPHSMMSRQTLLAELYGRLARSLSLPLLPLLAIPLGLTAKRGGRAPGIIAAGLTLLAFEHFLEFQEGLAMAGKAQAGPAMGLPVALFTGLCFAVFISGRKRPGETPIGIVFEHIVDLLARLRRQRAKTAEVRGAA